MAALQLKHGERDKVRQHDVHVFNSAITQWIVTQV
jgi:hypothetical protein